MDAAARDQLGPHAVGVSGREAQRLGLHPLRYRRNEVGGRLGQEAAARAEAQVHFDKWFKAASEFAGTAQFAASQGWQNRAAFLMHQATEQFYHCTLLTLTLYSPKSHKLNFLRGHAEAIAPTVGALIEAAGLAPPRPGLLGRLDPWPWLGALAFAVMLVFVAWPLGELATQSFIGQESGRFGIENYAKLDPLTVSLSHPEAMASLVSGKTEITAHFTSAPFMYQQLADPRVRRVLNSYDVFGGPHTFNSVWAMGRYRTQNPQIMAAFIAALDRAMGMIKDDPAGMADLWIEDQRSRLPKDDTVKLIRDPENVWTTTPMKIMAFAEFMHRTGGIRAKPDTWQDVYVEDIADIDTYLDRIGRDTVERLSATATAFLVDPFRQWIKTPEEVAALLAQDTEVTA